MRKNSESAGSFESLVGMKWASHAWKIFSELSWTGIWGSIGWKGRGREWWLFPGCPKCWVKKKKKRKENQAFGQLRKKKIPFHVTLSLLLGCWFNLAKLSLYYHVCSLSEWFSLKCTNKGEYKSFCKVLCMSLGEW